ncbi:hypothetical protein MSAN_01683500 [Mycena sanguinolenta]|uniref:Uncharacterized protein n=1 Tax=Mycena sanguinolenta TaxID=230812 RepID=A0A8H6Y0F2_9AGAR|nr:hypothetical protein MSAN_01683500 [Mycena sanguinolenta]
MSSQDESHSQDGPSYQEHPPTDDSPSKIMVSQDKVPQLNITGGQGYGFEGCPPGAPPHIALPLFATFQLSTRTPTSSAHAVPITPPHKPARTQRAAHFSARRLERDIPSLSALDSRCARSTPLRAPNHT